MAVFGTGWPRYRPSAPFPLGASREFVGAQTGCGRSALPLSTTDFPPLLSMGDRVITDPAMRTIMGPSACASEGAHTTKSKAYRHHRRSGVGMIADAAESKRPLLNYLAALGFIASYSCKYAFVGYGLRTKTFLVVQGYPAQEVARPGATVPTPRGDRPSRHRTPTPATGRRVICRRVPLHRLRLRVSDGWRRDS